MDLDRFDALTRAVSAASRRRLVRGLAGAALGAGLPGLGLGPARAQEAEAPCKKAGKPCEQGGQCCSRLCFADADGEPKRCRCKNGELPCKGRCCSKLQGCNKQGRCVPHCKDGKRSGNETDIDCGGRCLKQCPVGFKCRVAGDCESGICFDPDGDGQKHCGECIDDADCANPRFPFCNGLLCVQCRADADCADEAGEPFCRDEFCHECRTDADCPDPAARFCGIIGKCDECREDEHCPGGTFCDAGECVGCPSPEEIGRGRAVPRACPDPRCGDCSIILPGSKCCPAQFGGGGFGCSGPDDPFNCGGCGVVCEEVTGCGCCCNGRCCVPIPGSPGSCACPSP